MPQNPPSEIDKLLVEYSREKLDQEADRQGVSRDFARRIAGVESSGRPDVINTRRRSSAGAIGTMQLMPDTAKDLKVDPYHVDENIEGGVRYLKQNLGTFGGDEAKAAAAYNAGPGAVKKYGGTPPYRETKEYVRKVGGGSEIDNLYSEFVGQTKRPSTAERLGLKPAEGMTFDLREPRQADTGDIRPQRSKSPSTPRDRRLGEEQKARSLAAPAIAALVRDMEGLRELGDLEGARSFARKIAAEYGQWMEVGKDGLSVKSKDPYWNPVQPVGRIAPETPGAFQNVGSRFMRGAVGATAGFHAGVPLMPADPESALAMAIGEEIAQRKTGKPAEYPRPGDPQIAAKMAGQARQLQKRAETAFPVNPNIQPSYNPLKSGFWQATLPEAAGSAIPTIAAATASGPLAPATSGIIGMTQGAGQTYMEAKEFGAGDREAQAAAGIGAMIGTTEAIGLGRILGKMGVARPVLKRLIEIAEEYGQETAASWLNDLNAAIASGYDPRRDTSFFKPETQGQGLVGAVFGLGAQGRGKKPGTKGSQPVSIVEPSGAQPAISEVRPPAGPIPSLVTAPPSVAPTTTPPQITAPLSQPTVAPEVVSLPPRPRLAVTPPAQPMASTPPPQVLAPPQGRIVNVGGKDFTLTPEQEARWKTEIDQPSNQAKQHAADLADRQEADKYRKGVAMRLAAKKREIVGAFTEKEKAQRSAREATNYRGKTVSVDVNGERFNGVVQGPTFGRVRVKLEDGQIVTVAPSQIGTPEAGPSRAIEPPNPRDTRGAIIAQPSSLPSRKLLGPGRPEDVPTRRTAEIPRVQTSPTQPIEYPDAPETQEMPEIRQRIAAENAPTRELQLVAPDKFTDLQEPANRITAEDVVTERPEIPAKIPQSQQAQPVSSGDRPVQRLPKATDENIGELRKRQEELGKLAYYRRGDFTGDLRDEYNRLNSIIREYDNARAPRELAPPPGREVERPMSAGEKQVRQETLQPKTGPMPETLKPGRKVTQEVQIPRLKPAESFISREDARQGYFEQFDDAELVDEIRRMEEIRNQEVGGRSKLTREQLEANRFDLKIAVEMQKERRRLQEQIGIEPGQRIAPRTPGRKARRQIQHSTLGLVVEAENQKGVPAGKLKVIGPDGKESTIQNPRSRGKGNQSASFVKAEPSTGAIPAEAMPELRG